jgi:hypothetical protein
MLSPAIAGSKFLGFVILGLRSQSLATPQALCFRPLSRARNFLGFVIYVVDASGDDDSTAALQLRNDLTPEAFANFSPGLERQRQPWE